MKRQSLRPMFLIWNVLIILLVAGLCFGSQQLASYSQQNVSANGLTAAVSDTANGPIQTCVPSDMITPTPLDLSGVEGLKQQIDSPQLYQIFGNSAADLRDQIKQCAPATSGSTATYTAETSYQLNWQYRFASNGQGACVVGSASVGIHVVQTMPVWQPTAQAKAGLATQWNSFTKSLATHENGHTTLNIQQAQTLLNDLKQFPAAPCNQIKQSVEYLANSDVAALAQANDNYDTTTNHGATQGAVLPN